MREILIAALAAAGQPQPSHVPAAAPQAAPISAQAQAVDPARVAAARRLIDLSWPREAFQQDIRGSIASDWLTEADPEVAALDPHHEERSRLTAQAVEHEVIALVDAIEPEVRDILARYYARRMTGAEIEAANAFYATPMGQRIITASSAIGSDPAYARFYAEAESTVAEEERQLYVDFVDRLIAATAHLPPLPGLKEGLGADPGSGADIADATAVPGPPLPRADPARLAVAQRIADLMWPEGRSTPRIPLDPAADIIGSIRIAGLGFPLPDDLDLPPEATLGDMLEVLDPHYLERARIAFRLLGETLARAVDLPDPGYRRATAEVFARAFTGPELEALAAFYAAPAGRSLIRESHDALGDPEFIGEILAMIPRGLAAFYPAMERVTRATAHLPPPPAPGPEGVEDAVRNDI